MHYPLGDLIEKLIITNSAIWHLEEQINVDIAPEKAKSVVLKIRALNKQRVAYRNELNIILGELCKATGVDLPGFVDIKVNSASEEKD